MVFGASELFAQAKKPTIMVEPSDVWCNTNGYMLEFDNQGTKVKVPDYKAALQSNADLLLAISKLNELMASRGFPLKNLESALKTLQDQAAEDAMLTSKGGAEINESPIDKLKKVAKADIWMQATWTVNATGPKKSVTFNLQGLDSYTDKQIAGASGTGKPSFSAELPVLLEEAVLGSITTILTFNFRLILTICLKMVVKLFYALKLGVLLMVISPLNMMVKNLLKLLKAGLRKHCSRKI